MTTQVVKGEKAGTRVTQPEPPAPGELTQTPREIQGPFFRLAAPERSNLLEPGDKPELILSGRVINERGVPIPGAIVNLWSSDAVGNYDMVGYRYTGYQVTDAQGRYEFTSIIPGCYEPRDACHFHVMVQGDSSPIVTQLYIEGIEGSEEDDYYNSELLIKGPKDANGVMHGTFDFVIKQVTEKDNVTPESLAARV